MIKLFEKFQISKNAVREPTYVLISAPNSGKCPNYLICMLSFDHYGPRGEDYCSCVKYGFVVKK